jgi:altronate hydrolase
MASNQAGATLGGRAVVRLHPSDAVVVVLRDIAAGELLDPALPDVHAVRAVPQGHKLAVEPLAAGAPVRKFGQVIGMATAPIAPGEHVHTHNLAYTPSAADRSFHPGVRPQLDLPVVDEDTFLGIVRTDGSVATRNYIGVMTSVNCANTVARLIAEQFRGPQALADFPNVDGIVALTHKGGCGARESGDAIAMLRRTLGGYARHPNFAAVLLVGLGCEDNQIGGLLRQENLVQGERVHAFTIQESGGT